MPSYPVPEDLRAALEAAGLLERFEALPYPARKQHALAVEDAPSDATRARRVRAAVRAVAEG